MSEQSALDLWIAERLFGFDPAACTCWLSGDKKTVVLDEFCPQHGDTTPLGPPRYSSTGEGMLAVLTALKERGWLVILKVDGLRDGDFNPAFTVLIDSPPRSYDRVDAPTAPEAVARAARAALEAESR